MAIEITKFDEFAQAAFRGYKSLNRIQSRMFRTVYYTNENILVCAPIGAGKRNIAMISILHEIGQHFKDEVNAKEADKVANQLQSTGISSGGDGAASS
ncbi:hypothetical protein Pyn_18017 [Prunus yedoensis var. nudiflora]|uniref:DEAD/DEAH box helicase domain-containing protein n=1 Tax=Prunus yedoensis var. nudiflora TaxID=2094558 RepID=A0A314YET9_PRUYE|nr:hypothetical protein Pyn_18017 [Prunus yedoensis var. nudiflora]